MTRRVLGGGLLIAGGLLWIFRKRDGGAAVPSGYAYPSFVTGRRLTSAATSSDGYVHTAPSTLAAQARLDVETYSLARFLGSEYDSGSALEKAAIAWTILNRARRRGWTIKRMATTVCRGAGNCTDEGLYGQQETPGGNRYASTARDPSDRDGYVATMALAGRWPDLTQGGDQFFDPRTQARLHRERPERYKSVPDLLASWGVGRDKRVRPIPGVDATQLVIIGPA